MSIQPRHLLVKLLLGARDRTLSAREAVAACAVFGVRENSVRVALARLSSAGMVEATGRGTYRIGEAGRALADEVRAWRSIESRLRTWRGGFVAVHTGGLGRSDRAASRRRERALGLVGLRELARGLFVRPDNLRGGVVGVRERLSSLGLEADAAVFSLGELDPKRDAAARRLWDGPALDRAYVKGAARLSKWLSRARSLDPVEGAREAFLLGDDAIRRVIFDPLLPAPLVDVEARARFFAAVHEIDEVGHELWRALGAHLRREAGSP